MIIVEWKQIIKDKENNNKEGEKKKIEMKRNKMKWIVGVMEMF